MQTLDLNGLLISQTGEKFPCKLINISDKGYIELYSIDELPKGERFQLVIQTPKIATGIAITAVENLGDTYHIEAIPEEPAAHIQAKIVEQRVRGMLK